MEEKEIFEKLKELIGEQFGIDKNKVTENFTFNDDIAADSLDKVELVMNLEDEFNIEVLEEDIEKIITVGDMVKYIKSNI